MYGVVGIPVTDFARLAELKGMKFYEFRREDAAVDAAATAATGWNKGENNVPTQSAATLGDSNPGMHLTIGILAALLQREHTGEGTFVYQSMQDAVLNLCRIKLRNQIMLDNLGALLHYAVYPNWKWGKAIPRAEIPIVRCIPEFESPKVAADWVGTLFSPLFQPVAAVAAASTAASSLLNS